MQRKRINKHLFVQHWGISSPKTTENINNLHIGNKRNVHENVFHVITCPLYVNKSRMSRKSKIALNRILINNTVIVFGIRTS